MKLLRLCLFWVVSVLLLFAFASSDDKVQSRAQAETKVIPLDSTNKISDITISDNQEITDKIIAYYFHGTRRCVTCKKLEAYSQEAIKTKFKDEIESGQLEFVPINFDEKENEHFIKDYALYTKSLVICDYNQGKQIKWKNLDKIWELVNDKEDYLKYVQDEISAYLDEGSDE